MSDTEMPLADETPSKSPSPATDRNPSEAAEIDNSSHAQKMYVRKFIELALDAEVRKLDKAAPGDLLSFVDFGLFLREDGLPAEDRIKEFVRSLPDDPAREDGYAQGIGLGRQGGVRTPPRRSVSLDARHR